MFWKGRKGGAHMSTHDGPRNSQQRYGDNLGCSDTSEVHCVWSNLADCVYRYGSRQWYCAILPSLPMISIKQSSIEDWIHWISHHVYQTIQFIVPKFPKLRDHPELNHLPKAFREFWENVANVTTQHHSALSTSDFMLRNFDSNQDGTISRNELLNMTEWFQQMMMMMSPPHHKMSWMTWIHREWPLFDWKLGVFLWRTFGGILLVLAILSIIPGRLHAISGKLLRWPVLGITYCLIGVELVVYVVIRLFIRVAENLIARPKHRKLRRKMELAKSYPEWYQYATELDRSQKRDRWLYQMDDQTSKRYNWDFIRELIKDMQRARNTEDPILALAVLQQCTRKNVGGVMTEDLFSYSNSGEPKQIVKEFVEEVVTSLHWLTTEAEKISLEGFNIKTPFECVPQSPRIEEKEVYERILHDRVREEKEHLWDLFGSVTDRTSNGMPSNGEVNSTVKGLSPFHRLEVLSFLKRARGAYGRTALCLSGGAMMGLYHLGHVLGLLEAGVLPGIISGTSGGSVIAALLCTRTDDEIRRDLDPLILITKLICFSRPWSERLKSVWQNGNLFDFDDWMEKIVWFTCGQMTFEESYRKTGRILCVTLSSTTKKAPPVLLNYLTTPNVTIASAVIASAAVPGFIAPVRLQYKGTDGVVRSQAGETYFDGSIEQDIPVTGLAEIFNCQFYIAAQCNPHIVPFFYNSKGGVGRPSRWSSGMQEDSWRGGFLLAALEMYIKNDMKAKMRFLHELEAAVGFTSSMMVQDFHIRSDAGTTIVPQVSFIDYFKLFSDPKLDDLYRYFQAGSVAAYEHIAMIKLHYSLVDIMDDCIQRLEEKTASKRRVRPRTQILMPETKNRATIVISASKHFSEGPLTPSPEKTTNGHFRFSQEKDEEEDEDEIERNWIWHERTRCP